MRVKICGITNLRDALTAAEYGADAVGFVLYRSSPRFVEPKAVRNIVSQLPPFVTTVGVFADEEAKAVRAVAEDCGIDIVQLQGDESPEYCRDLGLRVFKAIRIHDRFSLNQMIPFKVRAFVLDTFRPGQLGGTGETFDWKLAVEAKKFGSIILAGGLTPDNIREAVETVRPMAVDVSSGVEERMGKKDPDKVKRFIEGARQA